MARCAPRLKIIVGAGTHSTSTTVSRTRALVDARCRRSHAGDAVLQQNRRRRACIGISARQPMPQRCRWCCTTCRAAPVWICCPRRWRAWRAICKIVAVKEATPQVARMRELLAAVPADFSVLSGDDASAVDFLGLGAKGVISVTAKRGSTPRPRGLPRSIAGRIGLRHGRSTAICNHCNRDLFVEANPIPVKWAVARMGPHGERNPITIGRIESGTSRRSFCARCAPPVSFSRTKQHEI